MGENAMQNQIRPEFAGKYEGTVTVNSTLNGVNTVEDQIVLLEIKKIYDTGYLCVFTQVYPPVQGSVVLDLDANKFTCVVNKSTESDWLMQGVSTGGLNSMYFKSNDVNTLYSSFSTSFEVDSGRIFLSGTQTFKRVRL
jgi:hypothetical protein